MHLRYHHLDWLRIFSVLLIFIFHSGAPFAFGDWHFKSGVNNVGLTLWGHGLLLFSIPLLFLISGASTFFSLKTRSPAIYLKERVHRLFIPLLFGILVIVSPQVYIERISRDQFSGNFIDFYPHYFDGWYLGIGGEGNFAWMGLHLWFLLFLFLLTLVVLVWLKLRKPAIASTSSNASERYFYIKLLSFILPIIAIEMALGVTGLGGWNLLTYPFYFFLGYWLYQQQARILAIRRLWKACLLLALAGTFLLLQQLYQTPSFTGWVTESMFMRALHAITGCSWVLALIGFAQVVMEFKNRWMVVANEFVLPFYILHQTVIVLVVYFIWEYQFPLPLYYSVTLSASMLVIVLCLFFINKQPWLRFLFGMRATSTR